MDTRARNQPASRPSRRDPWATHPSHSPSRLAPAPRFSLRLRVGGARIHGLTDILQSSEVSATFDNHCLASVIAVTELP